NSLKPVVLPGETMKVFIVKEGKEQDQGVAYLDDGTMVVVNAASKQVGKTVDVTVTSVVQTAAGKMFFGRCLSENDRSVVRRPQREKAAEGAPGPRDPPSPALSWRRRSSSRPRRPPRPPPGGTS